MSSLKIGILILTLLTAVSAQSKAQNFKDFSQKGSDYKALENLRFYAADIVYLGDDQIKMFEKQYLAKKYTVTIDIKVQTQSVLDSNLNDRAIYERIPAIFEVSVAEDENRNAHNTLVRAIHENWKKGEIYSGEFFFDFNASGEQYSLTAFPDLVNVKSFYFVWVNGRVIKVAFKEFLNSKASGWGKMDRFTSDVFRIHLNNSDVQAYQFPLQVRKQFFEMYQRGTIKY